MGKEREQETRKSERVNRTEETDETDNQLVSQAARQTERQTSRGMMSLRAFSGQVWRSNHHQGSATACSLASTFFQCGRTFSSVRANGSSAPWLHTTAARERRSAEITGQP